MTLNDHMAMERCLKPNGAVGGLIPAREIFFVLESKKKTSNIPISEGELIYNVENWWRWY
jgi:hypothetical protein